MHCPHCGARNGVVKWAFCLNKASLFPSHYISTLQLPPLSDPCLYHSMTGPCSAGQHQDDCYTPQALNFSPK